MAIVIYNNPPKSYKNAKSLVLIFNQLTTKTETTKLIKTCTNLERDISRDERSKMGWF